MLRFFLENPAALVACLALYLVQGFAFWNAGMRGLGLTHYAYAVANVGLIWAWYEARSPS